MKQNKLVNILIEKGYKISAAESCTGGLFASKIISVPDASKVLDASFITYSNNQKIKLCGVSENSIKTHGVVSEKVAGEMAQGVAINLKSNIGVGISGIAGPTGGTKEKPIGMVCFGFFVDGRLKTFTKIFKGNRNSIRRKSVQLAINKLIEIL